jgi:hypothetical protein
MPALSMVESAALATVRDWLEGNPVTPDIAGQGLFRADTPATKAIKGAINEGCREPLKALLRATIDGALQDIERQKAAQRTPFWRRSLELSGAQRDHILVRQFSRNFLEAANGGQVSPMRAAVPQGTAEFLRLLAGEVRKWADPVGLADQSVVRIVPVWLILRGASSWDFDVPGEPTSPDRLALELSLRSMLGSLATAGRHKVTSDPAVPNSPETEAAVIEGLAAIKPQFQAVLQSLIH